MSTPRQNTQAAAGSTAMGTLDWTCLQRTGGNEPKKTLLTCWKGGWTVPPCCPASPSACGGTQVGPAAARPRLLGSLHSPSPRCTTRMCTTKKEKHPMSHVVHKHGGWDTGAGTQRWLPPSKQCACVYVCVCVKNREGHSRHAECCIRFHGMTAQTPAVLHRGCRHKPKQETNTSTRKA